MVFHMALSSQNGKTKALGAKLCLESLIWFFPTTIEGGKELYTQMEFWSVNFYRLIYSSKRVVSGIIHKIRPA